jgi:hypothetical protein
MNRLIALLLACATAACSAPPVTTCPAWPAAGPAVAEELQPPAKYPATWGWIARLATLRDQLEACRR